MKYLFILVLIIHALIHLVGSVRSWSKLMDRTASNNSDLADNNPEIIKACLWLASCFLLLLSSTALFEGRTWWWLPAIFGIMLSQSMIIYQWKEAKWGTMVNLFVLLVCIVAFAEWNFNRNTAREVNTLFSLEQNKHADTITATMLTDLPAPVQNWLIHSGIIGKEKSYAVRLRQVGLMRTKPGQEKWLPITAEQYITITEPSYIWKARMDMMPLVPVTGKDRSVGGKGLMQMKVFSLFNVVKESDLKIDEASLQRWLSEICWFPSAALNPYIQWESINDLSAKATLQYKGLTTSVIFDFNREGDMVGCTAERFMGGGKNAVKENWQTRSSRFALMNGIRIPVESEVTWKLKQGDFTWYHLEIKEVEYNKPAFYQ